MYVSQIQARTQKLFGDVSGAQIDGPMILDWINDGQTDICRKAECLEAIFSDTLGVGDNTLLRPVDFIRESWVKVNGVKLQRQTAQSIDILYPERSADTSRGQPLYYYHFSQSIHFYPTPDIAYDITMAYIRNAIELTASEQVPEIPYIFHGDLVQYCFYRALQNDEQWVPAREARDEYGKMVLQTMYDSKNLDAETYPSVRSIAGDNW